MTSTFLKDATRQKESETILIKDMYSSSWEDIQSANRSENTCVGGL